jgi:uncharacterized membrane protein
MKVMKVFYSLVCTSVFSLGLFFLVSYLRFPELNWESGIGLAIQFNILYFFISGIVSYVFVGPLLIALLDRVLRRIANPQGIVYRVFFTHHLEEQADHAVPLDFGGYQFFVCTRCSGTVSGILVMVFIDYALITYNNGVEIISPLLALILCISFTIPALVDWGTQKMLLRTSNDTIRLITGLMVGAAIHLLTLFVIEYPFAVLVIFIVFFGTFFILFFLGTRKLRRFIYKEFENFEVEEEQ